MNAIGFFSGVGGIELGFRQAGIKTIWANEIDEKAAITYRLNHDNELIVKDIYEIEPKDIPDSDILLAGFPCQPFSIAGYQQGFEDKRGNVFFKLAKIIKIKRPKVVFLENVKNIVGHDNGNTYRVIYETLRNYGYYVKLLVLNSAHYGNIPQNRERAYIIGFSDKKAYQRFEEPTPIPLNIKIGDIVNSKNKIDEKFFYTSDKFKHFNELQKKITNKETLYQWRRVYVRENKSNLCPTLTANMGMGGHNVPLVLTDNGIRKLTPKECFMFQGYPNDFKLPNIANSHLYKQAGNSVVVPVIKRLASNIIKAL